MGLQRVLPSRLIEVLDSLDLGKLSLDPLFHFVKFQENHL